MFLRLLVGFSVFSGSEKIGQNSIISETKERCKPTTMSDIDQKAS